MRTLPWRIGAVFVLACTAACGGLFATRIGRITSQPGAYDGRVVTVAGEVTGRANLVVVKFFRLRDESGEIAVVTERPLPPEGEKVRVKGTVKQAFALGNLRAVVILEEAPGR